MPPQTSSEQNEPTGKSKNCNAECHYTRLWIYFHQTDKQSHGCLNLGSWLIESGLIPRVTFVLSGGQGLIVTSFLKRGTSKEAAPHPSHKKELLLLVSQWVCAFFREYFFLAPWGRSGSVVSWCCQDPTLNLSGLSFNWNIQLASIIREKRARRERGELSGMWDLSGY